MSDYRHDFELFNLARNGMPMRQLRWEKEAEVFPYIRSQLPLTAAKRYFSQLGSYNCPNSVEINFHWAGLFVSKISNLVL